jgi:hypothetical protein
MKKVAKNVAMSLVYFIFTNNHTELQFGKKSPNLVTLIRTKLGLSFQL